VEKVRLGEWLPVHITWSARLVQPQIVGAGAILLETGTPDSSGSGLG